MPKPRLKSIIRYTGMKNLTPREQTILKTIINNEYEQIHRLIKNITDLAVYPKIYDRQGKRKRYIINIKAESPTVIFSTYTKETNLGKFADWDLARATHKAIDNLRQEIKHRLKADQAKWKFGGIKKLLQRRFYN